MCSSASVMHKKHSVINPKYFQHNDSADFKSLLVSFYLVLLLFTYCIYACFTNGMDSTAASTMHCARLPPQQNIL